MPQDTEQLQEEESMGRILVPDLYPIKPIDLCCAPSPHGPYLGFIGGQTPIYRRIPKVGFTNPYV